MSKKGWRRKEEKIQDQTRLHNKEKKRRSFDWSKKLEHFDWSSSSGRPTKNVDNWKSIVFPFFPLLSSLFPFPLLPPPPPPISFFFAHLPLPFIQLTQWASATSFTFYLKVIKRTSGWICLSTVHQDRFSRKPTLTHQPLPLLRLRNHILIVKRKVPWASNVNSPPRQPFLVMGLQQQQQGQRLWRRLNQYDASHILNGWSRRPDRNIDPVSITLMIHLGTHCFKSLFYSSHSHFIVFTPSLDEGTDSPRSSPLKDDHVFRLEYPGTGDYEK